MVASVNNQIVFHNFEYLLGGVLYKYGGFYLPFVVNGGSMVLCSIIALILFKPNMKRDPSDSNVDPNGDKIPKTKFRTLLKIPKLVYSAIILAVCGISCTWYLPIMQVGSVKLRTYL